MSCGKGSSRLARRNTTAWPTTSAGSARSVTRCCRKAFSRGRNGGRSWPRLRHARPRAMSEAFAVGDRVRVRTIFPPGHLRTPYYIRGKTGAIERVLPAFPNPEEEAYGRKGTPLVLYRVRFRQIDIWPDYKGGSDDTLDVEIFQHWLEGP